MGNKKRIKVVLSILMTVFLLIGMIPAVVLADEGQTLGRLEFVSSEDYTLIAGETRNINVQLYQSRDNLDDYFTGSVSATITDSEGNEKHYNVSGSQGNYSISNVTLDTPGEYILSVRANSPNDGGVERYLKVVNAQTNVTGSLLINTNNLLSIKLTDPDGNALLRKTITIDGSMVGATTQSQTTLSDGTVTFRMTPTQYGDVKIVFASHVIGTIPVLPAYTQEDRIGGAAEDNVALSIAVAQNGWAQGSHTVILARDDQFMDTMAAVPLSKVLNAPILMTNSNNLDDRTMAEIRNLGVSNIYIIGGTVAISQNIQDSLTKEFSVTRIGGLQGYDTAAQISAYVGAGNTHTVYLANGYALPDAIAVSAFAAEQRIPILLTDRDQLPTSTNQAFDDLKVSNVVLLGGTSVISSKVEETLRAKYAVKRWGGFDRYETQQIIFQNVLDSSASHPLYIASGLVRQDDVSSGKPYADALLTAALAAKNGGFVAMTQPNSLPSSLRYYLLFNKGYISRAAVVGNNSGVSYDLEQQFQQILKR